MKKYLLAVIAVALLAILAGAASISASAERSYQVGILMAGGVRAEKIAGLKEGLERYGYSVGKNISFVVKDAQNRPELLPELARELVTSAPDVIVALGESEAMAAKEATQVKQIPVVFVGVGSSDHIGLISDLAHPGGNITGVDNYYVQLSGKRLEYFKRLMPATRRVAVLYDPRVTPTQPTLTYVREVASSLDIAVEPVPVTTREEVVAAIQAIDTTRVDGAMLLCSLLFESTTDAIYPVAIARHIPVLGVSEFQTEQGLLASYGMPYHAQGVQAARLLAKVLRGQDPGTIPVESPAQVELVVNLSTAARIGVQLDPGGLAAANRLVTGGDTSP